MTPRRFQFTIKGMLWATFWVAVGCAAWVVAAQHAAGSDWHWYAWRVGLIAPCVAVGALLGQFKWGFYGGVALVALIYLYVAISGDMPPFLR